MGSRWWPTSLRELLWEQGESRIADWLQRRMEAWCRRHGHAWAYRGRTSYTDRRPGGNIHFEAAGRGCKRCLSFHVWTWDRQGITRRDAEVWTHSAGSSWPVRGTYWLRTHDGPPSDLKEASHEQL